MVSNKPPVACCLLGHPLFRCTQQIRNDPQPHATPPPTAAPPRLAECVWIEGAFRYAVGTSLPAPSVLNIDKRRVNSASCSRSRIGSEPDGVNLAMARAARAAKRTSGEAVPF